MSKLIKIGLILLVVLAVMAGVYLVSMAGSTELRKRAGKPAVFVSLVPAQIQIKRGEEARLAVKIDTDQETIGGVSLVVDFNPSLLRLVGAVEPGSTFAEVTSKKDLGQATLRGEGKFVGQGTVAVLTFVGVAQGEGGVEISEASVVWDEGITNNVLGMTRGAKLTVK